MKKLINSCLLGLLLALASCRGRDYSVVYTSHVQGTSDSSYIEGSIAAGNGLKDTLLYYRFDVLSGAVVFKEKAGLDIGIGYTCTTSDSLYVIKLGFRALDNSRQIDTALVLPPGGSRFFTTIPAGNMGKGTETAFSFAQDRYHVPLTPAYLVSDDKMRRFITAFKNELGNSIHNGDSLRYTSACHLDGNYGSMSMTLVYR